MAMRIAVAESKLQILWFFSQTTSLAIIPRVIAAPARELTAVKEKKKTDD